MLLGTAPLVVDIIRHPQVRHEFVALVSGRHRCMQGLFANAGVIVPAIVPSGNVTGRNRKRGVETIAARRSAELLLRGTLPGKWFASLGSHKGLDDRAQSCGLFLPTFNQRGWLCRRPFAPLAMGLTSACKVASLPTLLGKGSASCFILAPPRASLSPKRTCPRLQALPAPAEDQDGGNALTY